MLQRSLDQSKVAYGWRDEADALLLLLKRTK
jgi:hypothetical protein